MTARSWALRIRINSSPTTLSGLDPDISIERFQTLLEEHTGVSPAQQEILSGFPPVVLQLPDDSSRPISAIPLLQNGDALTVRRITVQLGSQLTDRRTTSIGPPTKPATSAGDAGLRKQRASEGAVPEPSPKSLFSGTGRRRREDHAATPTSSYDSASEGAPASGATEGAQLEDTVAVAGNGDSVWSAQQMDDDAALAHAIAASLADSSSTRPPSSPPPGGPPPPPLIPGLPPGSLMVRRTVEADNSCLFNAVGYVIHGSRGHSDRLRAVIARTVADDPETFTEAWLERPNDEYCAWILDQSKWGGAIELSILAKHYRVEIAAYDVQSQRCDLYGEGAGYTERAMVLYDGIHYDALALAAFYDAPENLDTSIFPSDGELALGAARSASEVVAVAHAARAYTDTAGFTLRCGICQVGVKGEEDARDHARITGHQDFQEY